MSPEIAVKLLSESKGRFWDGLKDRRLRRGEIGVIIATPSERTACGWTHLAFLVQSLEQIKSQYVDYAALLLSDFNLESDRIEEYRTAIRTALLSVLREAERAA